MSTIDYAIILTYLSTIVIIGLMMQRKAGKNIDSYFLGERDLPWWALASSGMSSNLDISGTMIIAALIYAMGAKGFYIEIRGGVTLIMAFLMIYMGKWNRRSGAMTLAEWMKLRFGEGRSGQAARLVAAISSIIMTVAMVTYFALGGGKFLDQFLGIRNYLGLPSEFWAATLLISIAMVYTVASGLYGVVWTDVFQGILIFGAIAYMASLAYSINLPEEFTISLPLFDGGFQRYTTTLKEWTSIIPSSELNIDGASQYSIYNLFGVAIMFYLMKVVLEGSGGTGNYMLQRFFAAKDDREAGLLSAFWVFLLSFRWVFIGSIAIIGVSLGTKIVDPELVLPAVVETLPIGIKGFLIAGLMAAGMSTFDSTVNAGAAYWVKDIYQLYINPQASKKKLMAHSYMASIFIVLAGLGLMFVFKNINDIWGWITMSIGSGLLLPMLLRWYWSRMNGWGFAIGTLSGMISAIAFKAIAPAGVTEYTMFGLSTTVSLIGTIIGTMFTKPTDESTLQSFYNKTRPFGSWGRFKSQLNPAEIQAVDKENRRDIFSTVLAVPWQVSFFLLMMSIMFKAWTNVLVLGVVFLVLSISLYFTWYKHLSTDAIQK
ncbi:MAG: sodium:solute symporter [Candidatus Marinimicrobia bacterium]|jgi:Na+/proline symporter|nr:sodium:solute symporter [Candidatus Neomarinimicrobiota bacterium]MBT3947568.1 sodium:solute symporter [Candidatus Neomarinimicrobiota bacterium]MBT4064538.1 sodium:solute symporter [Candidatus Neomarinimicrobiota bacterium]MBT4308018.1 sodium:solute symporter [Candidatus Neomarinimicrobiota bacterium]MBT4453100.1 sodium:solute symporter [Candidatus Neomarinimicrobiota bacterium]|tara:strand:+ start:1326 stop:3125 length:1800 start_codon:yes stop_codon:yes gene_type:complete